MRDSLLRGSKHKTVYYFVYKRLPRDTVIEHQKTLFSIGANKF